MITERAGNLLDDDAEVLVNTTNAVGVMGKGLALGFKQRWPGIMPDYRRACRDGLLRGGGVMLFDLPGTGGLFDGPPRRWAAFCTKHDWRDPSRYEWVEQGLSALVRLLREGGHRSVAVPALGCSNGGLRWERVRPMIVRAFDGSPVAVRLYAPIP